MYKCTLSFVLFLSAILLSIFIRFKLLISPVFFVYISALLFVWLFVCLFVCLFVYFVFCFSLFLILFFVFVFVIVFVVLFLGGGIILLLFLFLLFYFWVGGLYCYCFCIRIVSYWEMHSVCHQCQYLFKEFYYGFYSSRKIEAHYFICFPQFLNYIDILCIDKFYHK